MHPQAPWLKLSVAQALRRYPGLLRVLIKHRTGCVGCPMASFCSLRAAADIHHLEESAFFEDVERVIRAGTEGQTSGDEDPLD